MLRTLSPVASYAHGQVEVADRVWAYLQPDGSWGWSNAGLVGGDGASLLVDTLFDLRLTAHMLAAMAPYAAGRPITTVVNTHANGDHCHGNQLVDGARIITSAATAREMSELPPGRLAALQQADLGADANLFVAEAFGAFDFEGIDMPPPTETFTGSRQVEAGDRPVQLTEVGPAHTAGDVIAVVADSGVVFTGDILFIDSTPIIWAGPVANWLDACRRIRALRPTVIVPGHGPLTDLSGVAAVEGYLQWLWAEVEPRCRAGMPAIDAAWDVDLGPYRAWSDSERTVVNVDAMFSEMTGASRMDALTSLAEMGRYRSAHR